MYTIYNYNDLDYCGLKKQVEEVIIFLAKGDFRSAQVKKMPNMGYYRARLDYENRLLFQLGRYCGQSCILLLEVIINHNYAKSRFLKGAKIDESKLIEINKPEQIDSGEFKELSYLNKKRKQFHYLDKFISFDEYQSEIYSENTPQIIIGSAGSGKTVVTLEKLKTFKGRVLYITLSPFLAENASHLFYHGNYENTDLEIDFMSYREFIKSIKMPEGKEFDYRTFEGWFNRYIQATGLKDSHKTFEEFRGVLTGMDYEKDYLSQEDYLNLGVKQSIFLQEEKKIIYSLFLKYLNFLKENHYYDINILSHQWKQYITPLYDGLIIDEVQDLTNIQLFLILQSLKNKNKFILCGDSNQIVHPNFFSWSHIKTMLFFNDTKGDIIRILHTNFRNSKIISHTANLMLKIKHARFGSIDKESNYLVKTISGEQGQIALINSKSKSINELNNKTSRSTKYAVIVLRNDDKAKARQFFNSPLLFSVQESKGLEYENVILFNIVSDNSHEFKVITQDVNQEDLDNEQLRYNRAKDKKDKTAEVYKFYINSLYVAITRAINNIYIIEDNTSINLFTLLSINEKNNLQAIKENISSTEEWQKEAHKLEMQGKVEQAEMIRHDFLKQQTVPWEPITDEVYERLKIEALNADNYNKQAKDRLFDFSLIHNQVHIFNKLSELKYHRADQYDSEQKSLFRKYYQVYKDDKPKAILQQLNRYGIDYRDLFNMTPLHVAAYCGSENITEMLLLNGANPEVTETFGKTPLQIAIGQAFLSKEYAQNKLSKLYDILSPDSIKIKVNDRLIKINKSHIEYLLLNLFISVQSSVLQKKEYGYDLGMRLDDIIYSLANFTENILYDYRKKREYLSAAFTRNEVNSKSPYNRYLFLRKSRGSYMLNDNMEIMIQNQWKSLKTLIKFQQSTLEEYVQATESKKLKIFQENVRKFEEMERKFKHKRELLKNKTSKF